MSFAWGVGVDGDGRERTRFRQRVLGTETGDTQQAWVELAPSGSGLGLCFQPRSARGGALLEPAHEPHGEVHHRVADLEGNEFSLVLPPD
jgi:hypothetical protein